MTCRIVIIVLILTPLRASFGILGQCSFSGANPELIVNSGAELVVDHTTVYDLTDVEFNEGNDAPGFWIDNNATLRLTNGASLIINGTFTFRARHARIVFEEGQNGYGSLVLNCVQAYMPGPVSGDYCSRLQPSVFVGVDFVALHPDQTPANNNLSPLVQVNNVFMAVFESCLFENADVGVACWGLHYPDDRSNGIPDAPEAALVVNDCEFRNIRVGIGADAIYDGLRGRDQHDVDLAPGIGTTLKVRAKWYIIQSGGVYGTG
jgi:hypothetical protein